jgi:divalent metal cation (Fe/Co/Zn/Cd) transporter
LGLPWLVKADAIAAMGVAGIVIYVSIRLGRKTVVALLDAIPAGMQEEVSSAVQVPGVQQVKRVRIRRSGPETFADVTLVVDYDTALERAHEVAEQAEKEVKKILPGADVMIDVVPGLPEDEGVHNAIRSLANRQGLRVHGMRIYKTVKGGRSLELHVEVSERLCLEEAHEKATLFENALRNAPLGISDVVIHIEPIGDDSVVREATPADEARIMQVLRDLQHETSMPCIPHDVKVHRLGDELSVSFHCVMDGEVPIGQAHEVTEQVERLMRSRIPELGRVVIHTEDAE